MHVAAHVDIVVVGGGLAGAAIGGVLARGGLGVIIVEREAAFRDRVRGEFAWPWGVREATLLGLTGVFTEAGAVPLHAVQVYEAQALAKSEAPPPPGMLGFAHPAAQETMLRWASDQGASVMRPAKATRFAAGARPTIEVVHEGEAREYRARLVIGADGKRSAARRWSGGESLSDPEHHRFGGVAITGLRDPWPVIADGSSYAAGCLWSARGAASTRVYLRMSGEDLRRSGADRDFSAFVATAGAHMPPGALAGAQQAGPLAFFPNSCTWASRVAGNGVALVGDAAGSVDPSWGRGVSLLLKDVRELSSRLLATSCWEDAVAEYAERRAQYYDVLRAYDRWTNMHAAETGAEADRRRERRDRAKQADPTLGGFKLIEINGPDGLVADEAARRHYFGDDLGE
ncbi:MAG: FAD-dependent monooxygenase [Thermomicrobiales bacterium]